MESRPATVVGTAPLYIQFNGATSSAPALCVTSYTPVVGDVVSVIAHDMSTTSTDLLVLGTFG